MQILNSLYPYPVLSDTKQDYTKSSFTVTYQIIPPTPFKSAQVRAKFALDNPEISQLIKDQKAAVYLHVESPSSTYRQMFKVNALEATIELDPKRFSKTVELTGLIIATSDIQDFQTVDLNPEIYGASYQFPLIKKGQPLAVSYTNEIKLQDNDQFQSIGSIIKVATTKNDLMYVDLDQNEIFIYLPAQQFQSYVNDSQTFGNGLISAIIFPSLIYVLEEIAKNGPVGLDDKNWYAVVKEKLHQLNITIDDLVDQNVDPVVVAQQILANPLTKMFLEIEGMNEDE